MPTPEKWVNPFGKNPIQIEYQHQNRFVQAEITLNSQKMILKIGELEGELKWTEDEIFVQIGNLNDRQLYVFRQNGLGFLINANGCQEEFLWS